MPGSKPGERRGGGTKGTPNKPIIEREDSLSCEGGNASRRVAAILSCLVLASTAFAQQTRPSFDCRKATYPDEKAICSDSRLAQLDQAANIALDQVPKDLKKFALDGAFEQLKSRHACGSNKVCILDNQVLQIELLNDNGAKVSIPPWVASYRLELFSSRGKPYGQSLPTVVGDCSKTKIATISSRFGEEMKRSDTNGFDAGSAVTYANKGGVVSYSYEEAIAKSAIGDAVVVCLVSIPRNCPKGDDRGRFYSTTNLRTMGTWILPDAQHMCGGA